MTGSDGETALDLALQCVCPEHEGVIALLRSSDAAVDKPPPPEAQAIEMTPVMTTPLVNTQVTVPAMVSHGPQIVPPPIVQTVPINQPRDSSSGCCVVL